MALKKKNKENSVPREQIIKVDPYEDTENVMGLMAKIASAKRSANDDSFWNTLSEAYHKEFHGISLHKYIKDDDANFFNKYFYNSLWSNFGNLFNCLNNYQNSRNIRVVVAGGFSSGKSSFLNRLTESANLLPTGVEPVSVVKTYLYCSDKNKGVTVKGVNQKGVLVNLNVSVLQAIQHAKKSNVYLASVLDKLFVEIYSEKLNGLAFIDTPGYNNSDKKNTFSDKTDRDSALEAMKEGDVLLWIVDCEKGTIVSDDIEVMKQFEGKIVVFFNKADKKGKSEVEKIVKQAVASLYRAMDKTKIIDILAYSTLDNRVYYSVNNYSLSQIIEKIRHTGNNTVSKDTYIRGITDLFDTEITVCHNTINEIEKEYKEEVKNEENWYDLYQKQKEEQTENSERAKEILIDSYDEILQGADTLINCASEMYDHFKDFYDGVVDFDENDHWGSSDLLKRAKTIASKKLDEDRETYNAALHFEFYKDEYRKDVLKEYTDAMEFQTEKYKSCYDASCEECKNLLEWKKKKEAMIKSMCAYRAIIMNAVYCASKIYEKANVSTCIDEDNNKPNVFTAIKNDDYKAFLDCFENGVDLNVCNVDGFNPLTYATYYGNNAMVQFMLQHNANVSLKDHRGHNAFLTAVENQYRDICKILIDEDPDLIYSTTTSGESIEDLANKQTFTKWIKNEINNAI